MTNELKKNIIIQILLYFTIGAMLLFVSYPNILNGASNKAAKKKTQIKEKTDTTYNGIRHKKVTIRTGKDKHVVSVLEADLTYPGVAIATLKAENSISGLERIAKTIKNYEKKSGNLVFGAINGNYWRRYSYYPIGPTIHDGEVIYMSTIKSWSSAFFDSKSRMYIDNFRLSGYIENSQRDTFNIFNVNIRSRKEGIIIYNKYGGKKIPFISKRQAKAKSRKSKLSRAAAKNLLLKKTHESPRIKAVCTYLNKPAVNRDILLVVKKIRKGSARVPQDGCIISFGKDYEKRNLPKAGDTLKLRYETNVNKDIVFTEAICGAPRIVRNSKANPENEREHLDNKRFINRNQRRTAIGTNHDQSIIYFVTVHSGNKKKGTKGASLHQMAEIMRKIGCSDAINLDGGSSTAMYAYNSKKERIYRSEGTMLSVVLAMIRKDDL